MNWDTIQNQWQTGAGTPGSEDARQVVQNARRRNRDLHRKVKRRDLIETTVALLMVPVFGVFAWLAFGKGEWLTAFASAFLIGWCLYVPWRLHKTRKLIPDPETSNDMLGYLKTERRATQGQYDLLRGVLRWYLGPAGFGVLLFYFSARGFSLDTGIYTLVVVGVYGLIYVANQRAAIRRFAPAIEQIDRQIEELSRDAVQGETT